jgi:uncharacterized protein YbaA (DUF1428 family)
MRARVCLAVFGHQRAAGWPADEPGKFVLPKMAAMYARIPVTSHHPKAMPKYIDGFLIPVPKKNLATYRVIARKAEKIWRDHGALDYRECVGDDLKNDWSTLLFPQAAGCKPNEVVVFSWITYKSRKHRDSVNKKVMADPRIQKMMKDSQKAFDCKRMAYGGFQTLVGG